jgi:peroxiredoxin
VFAVSAQPTDEQAAFAREETIQFPLLSDTGLDLVAALRVPMFRAAGADRLKRLPLVLDRDRVVRATLYPSPDVTGSVEDALGLIDRLVGVVHAPPSPPRRT